MFWIFFKIRNEFDMLIVNNEVIVFGNMVFSLWMEERRFIFEKF